MKKLFLAIALVLFPALMMSAQTAQKIGVVDTQSIIVAMPETKAMQTKLDELMKKYEDTIVEMQKEYQSKFEEFVSKKDTMVESIKLRKQQEIEDLAKRIQELNNVAQQDVQKKQVELFTPIQNKVRDAINKVGAENGFAYLMDSNQMIYMGTAAEDATALVRAKLGL